MADGIVQSPVKELTRLLETYFTPREDVESVFLNKEEDSYVVTVITNHETYQREAMFELLKREYHLRQEIQGDILFDIDYLPRLGRSPAELVSSTATLLFQR